MCLLWIYLYMHVCVHVCVWPLEAVGANEPAESGELGHVMQHLIALTGLAAHWQREKWIVRSPNTLTPRSQMEGSLAPVLVIGLIRKTNLDPHIHTYIHTYIQKYTRRGKCFFHTSKQDNIARWDEARLCMVSLCVCVWAMYENVHTYVRARERTDLDEYNRVWVAEETQTTSPRTNAMW